MKSAIDSLVVSFIAALILFAALGFALGYWAGTENAMPNCPQEDSCYADYYDGEWHIVEQQVK